MTKPEANEVKAIIKKEVGNFTVYFDSKKGELRITVCQFNDGYDIAKATALENRNIINILGALTNHGKRPPYHKAFRRYQGFINCRYIVFE